jgi:hypothetical protein
MSSEGGPEKDLSFPDESMIPPVRDVQGVDISKLPEQQDLMLKKLQELQELPGMDINDLLQEASTSADPLVQVLVAKFIELVWKNEWLC